jgi:hypothetical protein
VTVVTSRPCSSHIFDASLKLALKLFYILMLTLCDAANQPFLAEIYIFSHQWQRFCGTALMDNKGTYD